MGQLCIKHLCIEGSHTPFSELWSLCKIEETRLKAKSDGGPSEQVQAFATMAKRKEKLGKFGPQKKKKIDMSDPMLWLSGIWAFQERLSKTQGQQKERKK